MPEPSAARQLWPEEAPPQAPDVDDVSDQEQLLHLHPVQEIEHQVGAALARAQVDVRQEGRPYRQVRVVLLNHALQLSGERRRFAASARAVTPRLQLNDNRVKSGLCKVLFNESCKP